MITRRGFLLASAQTVAALPFAGVTAAKTRIGLVESTHRRLAQPASPEDPLDYDRVRAMVWKAIDYAGGMADRIRPGSWVVVKPNIVFLRPQQGYRSGDITDMRVTQAVVEYIARNAQPARITVAEGGSYRSLHDPAASDVVTQGGRRADAAGFDWGTAEFPGYGGTLGAMLREFASAFPGKRFDYIDLSYDAVRDASGALRRIEVPRTARWVGGFGARTDYFVTNTIRNCDYLVSVPVMKVHEQCGITACLKNYVGTAPREAYAGPGGFWNARLHDEHSLEGRIDSFITDLASFHPPDFSVVDGIRGLQYSEHDNGRPDQMLRNNLVLASRDPVAADALVAQLLGFNPWDIEFLHMAEQRDMGCMNLEKANVIGDDPARLAGHWGKPKGWYGRANREWLVTGDPNASMASWSRCTTPTDTLHFARVVRETLRPQTSYGAAVRVMAAGHRNAYLWVGAHGRVVAQLNGETVMTEESLTHSRIGQFQKPVELRSGENLLVFRVEPVRDPARLSVLLVGPRNDGDTVEGIRWTA
ncbi:MAG TPA: DUF362 domain-containing protein [Terriglobales bacterium]|nr:DUF362 domain-containing protein [Terriglobales bacterium]